MSKVVGFVKGAAPFLGATSWRILAAVGEPSLGLLVGDAVESGVAEGAATGATLYLGYKGVKAGVDFYKEQNAICQKE